MCHRWLSAPTRAQLFPLFPSSVLLQCDQRKHVRGAMSEDNGGKEAFPPSSNKVLTVSFSLICLFFKGARHISVVQRGVAREALRIWLLGSEALGPNLFFLTASKKKILNY